MNKPLHEVIFASEKRKNLLLLLQAGPKEMPAILESLDTTRTALLPQVKVLEKHYLVSHHKDTYQLTVLGKLIVDEITFFLDTLNVFDVDVDYMGNRDLNFIPPALLQRIKELYPYKIIEPLLCDINQPNWELIGTTASSKRMCAVTNIFHPNFMDLFNLWAENEVKIEMVLTKEFFEKLRIQHFTELQQLLSNKNNHFYLYDKSFHSLYFAVNDYCILLVMLRNDGNSDGKSLISYSTTALEWGKDLFDYYLKDSVPITDI
ncbi:winged helix-turn-helix domain-containing protein [Methanolobus sp.]|uniref:helix-turn-helix transcriptional regulator n=1 Tax=Methanolobus sp. TaxID=1874737 RepID=UPI0025F77E13|nr:winged helix-turn-helix domain-containing protein [Methanolobus sp.]